MCSSHNAPLSEVWIPGIVCTAANPFRQVAAWQIAAGVNECKRLTSTVMGMSLVRNWLSQQCVNVIAHNCRLGPLHEPHV